MIRKFLRWLATKLPYLKDHMAYHRQLETQAAERFGRICELKGLVERRESRISYLERCITERDENIGKLEIEALKAETANITETQNALKTETANLKAASDAFKTALQDHKDDKYGYDHYSLRQNSDFMFANIQLGIIERIFPGNKERLSAFLDSHRGQICFCIGNGPSLRVEDLDLLKQNNVFCLASNRINLIFGKTQWRPDVWSVTDGIIFASFNGDFSAFDNITKFLPLYTMTCENLCVADAVYFPHIIAHRLPFWLSRDIRNGSIEYTTVTATLINIAAYMGFEKIFLLGVDNTSGAIKTGADGKRYQYTTGNTHFSDKYEQGLPAQVPVYSEFAATDKNRLYRDISSELSNNYNISLLNATRGGLLDIERADFDEVIKNINPK